MANGAEPVRGGCLTHTVYIWPSPALIARSEQWPQSWHEAFEQAADEIGHTVASYVLSGLTIGSRPALAELRCGRIGFSVTCRGTSIYIAISEFEGPPGPDGPGPGDGTRRQHGAADGLVLGLRGTGRSFAVVTFYGRRPAVPAGTGCLAQYPGHPPATTPCAPASRHGAPASISGNRLTADYAHELYAKTRHKYSALRRYQTTSTTSKFDSPNRFSVRNTDYPPIDARRPAPARSLAPGADCELLPASIAICPYPN